MNSENEPNGQLRSQAEQELRDHPPALKLPLPRDPEALLQELQVHQIELRLQNDELIQTNLELEQARLEYQELFDLAPVGYLMLDALGSIQRVNLTLCRMLGVQRPRLLRKRFTAFLSPADASTFLIFLQRMLEKKDPSVVELWLIADGGARFAAQIQGEVVQNQHPEGLGVQARLTVTDITPQRQAQEQVLRLNAFLEERVEQRTRHILELNEELETFVHAVTHNLMTPLRHIRSFTGLLAHEFRPLEPHHERYIQHVEQSVDRMEQQLSALLTFFRTGRGRLHFRELQLNRVFHEVRKDLAVDMEGRDVKLTVDALPVVQGDSLALQLVFANLLGNALKFTRGQPSAQIRVQVRESERETMIGVQDNGVGFNMRQKDRLFAMFQRLHRQGDFEGEGVGLALVRRVIHRHGGRVWAEGKVGEGATFWFSLPKNAPEEG